MLTLHDGFVHPGTPLDIIRFHRQELLKTEGSTITLHCPDLHLTETLATELGFAAQEPATLRDMLAQRYRGSRYSFGYPACPEVADSRHQLRWLDAGRIGLSMDESDQLHPEQSTTALVALHSRARYFSA